MESRTEKRIIADLALSRDVLSDSLADQDLLATLARVADGVTRALSAGRKLLIAGNGGSAADAQHLAGEFVSRFNFDRAPLPAIALTTDSSVLTAISNDYGFEHLFERQIRGLGQAGDVFLAISTSGRSPNILSGLRAARDCGLTTYGLTGESGRQMADLCDEVLRVPSDQTPLVQQVHITFGHIICAIAEERIFGQGAAANRSNDAA